MFQISDILKRDMELFYDDLNSECELSSNSSENILVSDFTEYNPLHNSHFHCMKTAKSMFPDSLFVAVVPGLLDRKSRRVGKEW